MNIRDLTSIVEAAKKRIDNCESLSDLEQARINVLGKKGELTALLKNLGQLPVNDRPTAGATINEAKKVLSLALADRSNSLEKLALENQLAKETLDVSLPGRLQNQGSLHPVTRVRERVEEIFTAMGFTVETGPEIEDEQHNFNDLNFPEHHPARSSQDTFYLTDTVAGASQLLRTHTSPVQIRAMRKQQPPLKIITPGKVYRRDFDQTHTPMFHQLEGLMITENCTFTDLKGVLKLFLTSFFEQDLTFRFRPSYFPFTEPSAEVDIAWPGKPQKWLEILGCGMVHPQVLANVNIDSERFTGWAFGIGLDRLAMLRYRIDDLRILFENDLSFLRQF